MADKIVIDSDQLVSNNKGVITYIDQHGSLKRAPAKSVEVLPSDPSPSEEAVTIPMSSEPESHDESMLEDSHPGLKVTDEMAPKKSPDKPKSRARKKSVSEEMSQLDQAPETIVGESQVAKKTARKKAAKKGVSGSRTIGGKSFDFTKYQKSKTSNGNTSFNNGDQVAEKLAGKPLEDVYAFAAKTLKMEEKDLYSRLKHLNAGMQRMNLGNMVRKVLLPKGK